jgi:hypothetical protein
MRTHDPQRKSMRGSQCSAALAKPVVWHHLIFCVLIKDQGLK